MTTAKVISTVVEDEVVFMEDADIEFVSLVKYGANRTPFKILKQDKGGDMDKVITAVLIPKSLSEEEVSAKLEGYRTDEVKDFDTYKSYIQVDDEVVDQDTIDVVILDKESGVLGVAGALLEESEKEEEEDEAKDLATEKEEEEDTEAEEKAEEEEVPELKVVEKESLDNATMDSLYGELYAMADIVGGAMRQANIEPKMRQKTILIAIDNFKSFAEMLLKNLKEEDIREVKSEDHPDLEHTFKTEKAEETEEEEVVEEKAELNVEEFEGNILTKTREMVESVVSEQIEEMSSKVTELVESAKALTDSLTTISEKVKDLDTLAEKVESLEKLPEQLGTLTESVEKLESIPKTGKTEVDEDTEVEEKQEAFKGLLFRKTA